MLFEISGVEAAPLTPLCAGFIISFICSGAGISGAFLLLPWQVAFLGYTAPGVSGTNQIFNIIACPGGVLKYALEGRLLLPLALILAAGTLPGVFMGSAIRIFWLGDPAKFRIFAAFVLLWLGFRLLKKGGNANKCKNLASGQRVQICRKLSWEGFSFIFNSERHDVSFLKLSLLAFIVGICGGAYGVGGGAIISPFLMSFFGLSVHAIAGATLLSTFLTSVAGVLCFSVFSVVAPQSHASPDWLLGILLGAGGFLGMYAGAASQKYLPASHIRHGLAVLVIFFGLYWLIK